MESRMTVIKNFNRNLKMRQIIEARPSHWKTMVSQDVKIFGASRLREAVLHRFEGLNEYSLSFSDGRFIQFRT